MKPWSLFLLLLAGSALGASNTDWPVYRHDAALSGVSPGKGHITKPEIKWEYYLGAPPVTIATDRIAENPNIADLDGDGLPEIVTAPHYQARRLSCRSTFVFLAATAGKEIIASDFFRRTVGLGRSKFPGVGAYFAKCDQAPATRLVVCLRGRGASAS